MPTTYEVKQGETLSQIGQRFGIDWKGITGYKSGKPDLIYPGEILNIPDKEVKSELGVMTPDIAVNDYKNGLDKNLAQLEGVKPEEPKKLPEPVKEVKPPELPKEATPQEIESAQLTADLATAKKQKDDLIAQMSSYMITDEALNSQITNINALYDTRIRDMEDINKRREQSLQTTGIRLGSRYTGGMFGGVITEEERQGSQRITELQQQKQQAINAAKEAQRAGNWLIYGKQVDQAQKTYEEQVEAVKEFNKKIVDNNKNLLEIKKLQLDILKTTGEISLKKAESFAPYIADFLTGDVKADSEFLQGILAAHPEINQESLLGQISKIRSEREKGYLTEDIKNFQFAKQQGFTGDFSNWQIDEANRKAIAARVGTTDDLDKLLTPTEAQTLGLPYGTTRGEAMQKGITPEKPATEAQKTLSTYASRIEQSNPILNKLEKDIVSMSPVSFEPQIWLDRPWLQSDTIQQYMQASRNFINSVLRRESGAVISPTEFSEARKQYLPQPGDSKDVLEQKRQNREIIYQSYKKGAGSAYQPLEELLPQEYELNGKIYIKGADGKYYLK